MATPLMQPDELQARLAAIVANSDDAIIGKTLDSIVLSWNRAAERMFGYSAEEMIGRPIQTILPADRLDEEAAILARIRQGERVDHFETVRVCKDGRRIDVSVTISPIKDAAGNIVGASKIARDISERNQFIRDRERLYELGASMAVEQDIHTIVQMITDAAAELSGAQFGSFLYNVVNEAGESHVLYAVSSASRDEFDKFPMPQNTAEFAPTFDDAGAVRSDDITKDPRFGQSAPYHGMPFGHLSLRSYLAVPVMARSGEVLGGLFFGHEKPGVFDEHAERIVVVIAGHAGISLENARLQRELSETASRFQQLANSIPQLAWMTKPDGAALWYNDRWYEYTGMPPATRMNWDVEAIHDPVELPRVREKWHAALATGEPWEDTFPLRRHDGVFRWHLSRAVPIHDGAGRISMWFGTNTDITDQRKLADDREELLSAERAARSEAERVGRMKDEFLATLSHELRTPLSAILGWSQLLQRSEPTAETLTEGLAVIERNARIQTQLIADLLDMSRIISGKVRLDVQTVELAPVIVAAIDSLRPSAELKAIRLHKVLDPLAGPVSGDPNRLQQIVWNLLSNAIKFTPKGGKIEILLERINSHVEITVSDTGQGIAPGFLPHVFDRFRQADSSTTRHQGGLGLGLAIVKQLVDLHGGQIYAKSPGEGQGSTFSVVLPLAVTRRSADERQHPAQTDGALVVDFEQISLKGKTILVIDDEADARDLIQRLLVERDARVFVAESADRGLELLTTEKPDLVLSDIGMPEKDGYQFIRALRALPEDRGGKTAAVALTAFARSEDRTRAMLAGYQVHLSKPVEAQELIATVASLTGRTGA
jgi:PAS domain S-box-containing protein